MRLFLFVFLVFGVFAQKMHSHNDYQQKSPFFLAYELGFESIEADVYLKDNQIFVAHDFDKIKNENTFEKLYLIPILEKTKKNNGRLYADKPLQLLIDLKKDGPEILIALEKLLKPYRKDLKSIKIILSGDMPSPESFKRYDKMFFFDGRSSLTYTKKQWRRVALVSASLNDFGKKWNEDTKSKIRDFVATNHAKGKEVRLWGTPNTQAFYEELRTLKLDYIGADSLKLLAAVIAPKETK